MKSNKFMAKLSILIITLIICMNTIAADVEKALSLCNENEIDVFGCKTKLKIASLCLKNNGEQNVQMQYRFGTKDKIELIYPQNFDKSLHGFYLSTEIGSSRGEARIRFSNGAFEYYIFDISNEGDVYSGISVRKGNKEVARVECLDASASIKADAYSLIQREELDFNIEISRK